MSHNHYRQTIYHCEFVTVYINVGHCFLFVHKIAVCQFYNKRISINQSINIYYYENTLYSIQSFSVKERQNEVTLVILQIAVFHNTDCSTDNSATWSTSISRFVSLSDVFISCDSFSHTADILEVAIYTIKPLAVRRLKRVKLVLFSVHFHSTAKESP